MNKMQKSTWHYIVTILLLVALGIYVALEIAVLRRIPGVFGRIAPFLTFWSNIVISLALRPNESFPIWIVPMLNLSVLFAAIVVYEIVIPILHSFAHEGDRS